MAQISTQPYPYSEAQDTATKSIIIIDYPHHEIHSGGHYFYTDCVELGSAGTQDYLITTPNTTKFAHMSFNYDGSAITSLDVYEAGDRTGTTLQTTVNNNRNITTASTITVHKGTSAGTTDGTKIWCHKSGSANGESVNAGASSSQDSEIILKKNTKYLLRVTSGTASNLTNLKLSWYEHINLT